MKTARAIKSKTAKITKPKPSRTAALVKVAAPKAKAKAKAKVKAKPRPAKAVKASAPKPRATKPAPAAARVSFPRITTEQIASRAYFIWEQHGRPSGREGEHWQMAEQQLRAV